MKLPNVFDYNYVADWIDENKISQNELAAMIGVDSKCVSYWLRGISTPHIYYIAKIAKVMNCTIDELILYVD